ncbi:MAG TPA: T9SS type A sorting domain-containing protein [Chitinophagales bacterium]|nr:T9SS type A sorting domain-containing protein [Chitinophagales bacterium]HNE45561.1 T9SS type A sorting domain-containing protein [Chitinophagales bacterium]HNF67759.1 T9SS type A sorting domain-containing protein [Chitinophagales bacterium]HNM07704.1 T9SS type A sorting domain-containing protein [Chitinophagales bacterium]HNM29753.1 T9SS type A sorting domain-containing protein [Chitinophagales bacterium]
MKKLYNSKNAGKLAAYSAMAGAFVATTSEANATVVYTDIDDVTVELGETYALDLDNNGYSDFLMAAVSNSAGNWTWAYMIGNLSAYGYGGGSNMVIGYTGPILSYGSALNDGDLIGPDASFVSNTYNMLWLASIYSGVTYGPFANTEDKYIGVQFDIDGSLHYGWARLDVSVGPVSFTIKDYAYDDAEGTDISAGEKDVAINNLTEAQVAAYSYGNTINVVIKDSEAGVDNVNVFDIDGKLVYSARLTGSNMAISLDNAATGLYTLQLTGANTSFSKSLYIQN